MNENLVTVEKATDLSFILAGRWKMSFLQWSNPRRLTMPGQLLCSRVINQHIMESNIFVYFYLVTVCLFSFWVLFCFLVFGGLFFISFLFVC